MTKSQTTTYRAPKVALQARDPNKRTFKIESLLIEFTRKGRHLRMREMQDILDQRYTGAKGTPNAAVRALPMHIAHLFGEQLIDRDETNSYFVRPEVMQLITDGGPTTYRLVNELHSSMTAKQLKRAAQTTAAKGEKAQTPTASTQGAAKTRKTQKSKLAPKTAPKAVAAPLIAKKVPVASLNEIARSTDAAAKAPENIA